MIAVYDIDYLLGFTKAETKLDHVSRIDNLSFFRGAIAALLYATWIVSLKRKTVCYRPQRGRRHQARKTSPSDSNVSPIQAGGIYFMFALLIRCRA